MSRVHGGHVARQARRPQPVDIDHSTAVDGFAEEGAGEFCCTFAAQHERHQQPADAAVAVGEGMDVLEHPVRQDLPHELRRFEVEAASVKVRQSSSAATTEAGRV